MQHHGPAPLPGLVKLFLFQAYCWLAFFFSAHVATAFSQNQWRSFTPELFLWGGAFLLLSIIAAAVIVGIHTRSAWTASACRFFCVCCILTGAAAYVHFFNNIMGFLSGWDSLGFASSLSFTDTVQFMVALVACFPALVAWYRYFSGSNAVAASFPGGKPRTSPLPPLGVGLLMVLCWTFLAAKAMFFLCLWIGADKNSMAIMWRILLMLSPDIVFPAVLLWLIRKPGARIAPLLGLLCGWFFLTETMTNSVLIRFFLSTFEERGTLLPMLTVVGMTPMPTLMLGTCLAALGWRFATLPEEAQWLARRDGFDGFLSLPLFVMLYLCHIWLLFALPGFTEFFGTGEIKNWFRAAFHLFAAMFAALFAALSLWLFFARLGTGRPVSKKPDILFFAGSAICALLYMGIFLQGNRDDSLAWFLSMVLPHAALFAGLSAYGLALLSRNAAPEHRAPDMPLAAGCFLVFAVCILGAATLEAAANLALTATGVEDNGYFYRGQNPVFHYQAASFWLAWLACPAVVIGMLRKGLQNPGAFYAVCAAWLLTLFADQAQMSGAAALGILDAYESTASFLKVQMVSATVVLFMLYCAGSRELAAWRAGRKRL